MEMVAIPIWMLVILYCSVLDQKLIAIASLINVAFLYALWGNLIG